jgi:superfamily II DNA or RNA helicase
LAYTSLQKHLHIAPGNRVVIRDAEWLVRSTKQLKDGQILECVGISELVRDEDSIFLTALEEQIDVLDPSETKLVPDDSSRYVKSRLYLETLFRNTASGGESLQVGDKGAMDLVSYQIDPAKMALKEPRVRILIADAVGLGKTIEAGILMSELIQRGRGKRILVIAVKSMLTQFQKEMWARFTIPLVRLDSEGIQRIRQHLPSNYNPFSYYDRTIISIDTLKREAEYRPWLEQSYWDIIVIDEAHNVARRGSGAQRNKLAERIAHRCDTMIMLSATPHDGRPESFASLMNMLNPTAIADNSSYSPEDIKGLFIRRHKHDIMDQVIKQFPSRSIEQLHVAATVDEELVFDAFTRLDLLSDKKISGSARARGGRLLFRTQVEKALFSSIPACIKTVQNRIKRLEEKYSDHVGEINSLNDFLDVIEPVPAESTAKYRKLISMLKGNDPQFDWKLKEAEEDRIVIFTERIETMKWLSRQITGDLALKDGQLLTISGFEMSDIDQQHVVEEFGKQGSRVRILVASDVASEGINLHYYSHRMIHYDIPWSLMTFQQRNGRIDRFGQENKPEIYYLLTDADNPQIKGDTRILELLIEKDQHVHENIGDPGEFTGRYDIDDDETATGEVIESHLSPEEAEIELFKAQEDFLAQLFGSSAIHGENGVASAGKGISQTRPSLFSNDFSYYVETLDFLAAKKNLQFQRQHDGKTVVLTDPQDFQFRRQFLPREVVPDSGRWILTIDRDVVQRSIAKARTEEHTWPQETLLWDHHPIAGWLRDSINAIFGRHEAPVLYASHLQDGESYFLITAMIPNQAGQTVLQRWFAVPAYRGGTIKDPIDIQPVLDSLYQSGGQLANPGREAIDPFISSLTDLLPAVVEKSRSFISREREQFLDEINPRLKEHSDTLRRLKRKQLDQLELQFNLTSTGGLKHARAQRKQDKQESINQIFSSWKKWIEQHMQLEDDPFILVAGVVTGPQK